MNLNKNSLHYRLYRACFGDDAPSNLCPYFWKWVISVLTFLILGVYFLPLYILFKIKEKEWGGWDGCWRKSTFLKSLLLNFGILAAIGMVTIWFNPTIFTKDFKCSFLDAFGMTGYCIVGVGILSFLLYLLDVGLRKIKRSSPGGEKKPNIVKEYIKSSYKKYCPKIDWTEK